MRKHLYIGEEPVRDDHDAGEDDAAATGGLPNRLLTAFEVAEGIGCHEETVRRAYSHGFSSNTLNKRFTRGGSVVEAPPAAAGTPQGASRRERGRRSRCFPVGRLPEQ